MVCELAWQIIIVGTRQETRAAWSESVIYYYTNNATVPHTLRNVFVNWISTHKYTTIFIIYKQYFLINFHVCLMLPGEDPQTSYACS